MRRLKESNPVTERIEYDGRGRRMLWLEETEHEPLNRFFTRYPTEIITSRL